MTKFVPWSSQDYSEWCAKYAPGKFRVGTHYIQKGSGPPVILIHGFGSDSYTWHGNIDALAQKYTVYAIDMWGCGYSIRDMVGAHPNYSYFAARLAYFMDIQHIYNPFLIGQSMGAGTIVYFATQYREPVRGVILVGPAGLPDKDNWAQNLISLPGIGELLLSLPTDRIRKMFIKKVFLHDKELTPEYYRGLTWSQKIKGSNEAYLKILRSKFFHSIGDRYADFGKLNIPTMVVWGKYDAGNYLNDELVRLIPHAKVQFFEHSGHEAHDEEAELFNYKAMEFLQGY